MKTGRLLKFQRPGADVQAYLYCEGGEFRATVFVLGATGAHEDTQTTLTGESEAAVESTLRAWIEKHYPGRD